MATLWIRQYSRPDTVLDGIMEEPGTDLAAVTFTTTTQSAVFAASTRYIRFAGSADFHYVIGANPTATVAGAFVEAKKPVIVAVQPGHKIAAVVAA